MTMTTTRPQSVLGQKLGTVANWDDERIKFIVLLGLSVVPVLLSITTTSFADLVSGTFVILSSPSGLFTDYFGLTSLGATFFNAGLLTLFSLLMVRSQRTPITGPIIAGLFTVFGFALFGKNLFNSIPIPIGVAIYAKIVKEPFAKHLPASLFGTALAPAVSYLAFGEGLPLWLGIISGYLVGIIIGIALPPMANYFAKLHRGLSLYNIGFTAGIVGMVVVGVFNILPFDHNVETISIFYYGSNFRQALITYTVSLGFLVIGFWRNGNSVQGTIAFLRHPGRRNDFVELEGLGRTLMNMGVMGILATTYVLAVGGQLNGPVLGAIYTIIGFAAFGKHPKNSAPIVLGVILASLVSGSPLSSSTALASALFGTTLAPISGVYGAVFGIAAGFLQMSLLSSVAFLHGGLNLYNSGFTAGFVAIVLIPFADLVFRLRGKQHDEVDM